MSITSNFPAIKPSLLLDFANTKQQEPRITFTRASTATYYGTQTAKAEENLLAYSQEFDQGGTWGLVNATVTANTEAAPDGTTTAETLADNATDGVHLCSQNISLQVNTPFTFSCFLKEGTNMYAYLSIRDAATSQRYFAADFNLDIGTVRTTNAGTSGTLTSSSITSVGNGWYRCVITGEVAAVGSMRAVIGVSDGTTAFNTLGAISYIGTGTTIFAWGAQLEQRSAVSAYTPTTTASITNYIPQLLTAASGVARFDNNPTTFESLGLEIEENRTNLMTYSEQFDNAAWTKTSSTITANTVVSPDGALTSDKLIVDSGVAFGSGFTRQNVSKAASAITYTSTVYAKAGEFNRVRCLCRDSASSANSASVTISLVDGSVVVAATAAGTFTSASSSTTSVGNGWYRISLTFTSGTETTIWGGSYTPYDSVATQGNGYSGIYIWGAQLEAGAFATSYIPTVASQVTRAADTANMTGTNFSSWFNQGEGTMYAEGKSVDSISGTTARRFAEVNDGSTSNLMSIEFRTTTQSRFTVTVSDTGQASVTSGGTINQFSKIAGAYAVNNFAFCANGTLGTPDTSGAVPVVTQLSIGNRSSNINTATINGTIKKIAYYPLAATSAQLQGLTS